MKFGALVVVVASLFTSSVMSQQLKAFEHRLVDICGVRDLLEANCNGATYIDTCDMCVHEAVKVACPAIYPPDCIALVQNIFLLIFCIASIYSQFSRHVIARGSCTSLVTVGPT